jgi:hypothetical protein
MIQEAAGSILSNWESFYVIIGSSAGALTGLQFVVMALIAESQQRASFREIDAFGTPTIVHFCVVLLISAILSAPWPSLTGADWMLGAVAVWGIAYTIIVLRRARSVTAYQPVLEDWIWHVVLPLLSYAVLLLAAGALMRFSTTALFLTGGVTLLLLFVGIHNAWDTVTFIVVSRLSRDRSEGASSQENKTIVEAEIPNNGI